MDEEILKVIGRVHMLFKKKGLTLSLAESCTGGLISHYLTMLSGASAFFEAGLVTYSIESKKVILGLSPETISVYGVVSGAAAHEMAEKVRALVKTDYGLSTTGNLGPDVLEGRERGLVYMAVSREGETFSRELRLRGERAENKEEAALSALKFLVEISESDK